MAPLAAYAAALRRRFGPTLDFDPLDGGVAARVLLLLETPGPRLGPAGFVSMDNSSGTSANLRRFLGEAGLSRAALAIWNVVPWIIHPQGAANRAPRSAELREGLAELPGALRLLTELRAVVLAGRIAASAEPVLARERPELTLHRCPHPSPTYVCTRPDIPGRLIQAFAAAAASAGVNPVR